MRLSRQRRTRRASSRLLPIALRKKSPIARRRSMLGLRRAERRSIAAENQRLRMRLLHVIEENRKTDAPSFFTGFHFQKMGIRREHLMRAGLDIRALKKMGFNSWFMRWVGFELRDFITERIPLSFILSGGFSRGRVENMYARMERQAKRNNPLRAP